MICLVLCPWKVIEALPPRFLAEPQCGLLARLHSLAGFSASTFSLDIVPLCTGKCSWTSSLISSLAFSLFSSSGSTFICMLALWIRPLLFLPFSPVFCFLIFLLCLMKDFLNFIFQPFFRVCNFYYHIFKIFQSSFWSLNIYFQ